MSHSAFWPCFAAGKQFNASPEAAKEVSSACRNTNCLKTAPLELCRTEVLGDCSQTSYFPSSQYNSSKTTPKTSLQTPNFSRLPRQFSSNLEPEISRPALRKKQCAAYARTQPYSGARYSKLTTEHEFCTNSEVITRSAGENKGSRWLNAEKTGFRALTA